MNWTRVDWILWTPRVLSILFACFISLFALDVFVEGRPWTEILVALLIHLIPTYLLILVLVLAWRRPWIGAAAYFVLACASVAMEWRHRGWNTPWTAMARSSVITARPSRLRVAPVTEYGPPATAAGQPSG